MEVPIFNENDLIQGWCDRGLFYGGLYLFSCPLLVFHNFIFSETTWVIITLQKQKQKSNENQKQNKKAILVSQNKHCSPTTT